MRNFIKKLKLRNQIILITISTLLIASFFLILVLPKLLIPFYEQNIYEMLKQPIPRMNNETKDFKGRNAFIIIKDNDINVSSNFFMIINHDNVNEIVKKATNNKGKIKINNSTFYYSKNKIQNEEIISITNDKYITEQKNRLSNIIIPTIAFILFISLSIYIIYSNYIVRKIERLKTKIKNIDDKTYNHNYKFKVEDELNELLQSIENTRNDLITKEESKNKMYQNISHELKTPLMVISSYLDAMKDKMINKEEGYKIISNEVIKLNNYVEKILAVNKINYIKELKTSDEKINLYELLEEIVNKYKIIKPSLIWKIKHNDEVYYGTKENWEIIVDNILTNFMRYAKTKIVITLNEDSIIFYNDGKPIENNLINNLFDSYKKGKDGNNGLGLFIVKETLNIYNYKIEAKNKDNGVEFIIITK